MLKVYNRIFDLPPKILGRLKGLTYRKNSLMRERLLDIEYLGNWQWYAIITLTKEESVVGWALLAKQARWARAEFMVYVMQKCRLKGYGRKLLVKAEKVAAAAGFGIDVYYDANPFFFESMGYTDKNRPDFAEDDLFEEDCYE